MRLQKALPLLVAAVLAGCGGGSSSSGSGSGPDPATVIPAGAPVYVEAAVRPDGEQGDNARELLDRFLGDKSLVDLIDEQLAEEDKTYADDIEPWLGERAAVGVVDLAGDDAAYVAALQITDSEATQAAFDDPKEVGEHSGVTVYEDDGDFGAVTDDFLLVAKTRELVEAAIDRGEDESLASDERFEDAMDDLPDERLGAFYVDTAAFGELVASQPSVDPASRAILDRFLGDNAAPVTGALTAQPNGLTVESRLTKSTLTTFSAFTTGEAPELVKEAPAGSLAVLGYTDVGQTLKSTVELFAGALGGAALTGQLEAQTGINLDRDVFSWIGDVSLFVRGDSVQDLDGALVIEETDPDAAAAGIDKLLAAARRTGDRFRPAQVDGAEKAFTLTVPGIPAPLVLAYDDEHAVLAVGDQAAADALNPTETVEDSGLHERAEGALEGVAPSTIVDLGAIVALAEADGAVDDPDFAEAQPYLEMLDLLATGGKEDGDELRSLFTVTVKEG